MDDQKKDSSKKEKIQQKSALNHEAHILDIAYPRVFVLRGLQLETASGIFRPEEKGTTMLLADHLPAPERPQARALDMGCGSGALAITMGRQGYTVVATDKDIRCCAVTRRNARRNDVTVDVRHAPFWDGLRGEPPFDLIVSDLPLWDKPIESPEEESLCDPGGAFLLRFLAGLDHHLSPQGLALFTHSNAAVPLPTPWARRARVLQVQNQRFDFLVSVMAIRGREYQGAAD